MLARYKLPLVAQLVGFASILKNDKLVKVSFYA